MITRLNISSPFFVAIILLAVCLITYANSLDNPFMMDDDILILQDKLLHSPKFLLYQFIPDKAVHLKFGSQSEGPYYRPFAHIVPMISYLLFKDNPVGHHFMNLLLFWGCCFSVYILLKRLLEDRVCAFWASLFFCVHPINGLYVNYITASVYSVQMIFMSWAFLAFMKTFDGGPRNRVHQFSAGLGYLLACLCHEVSLMLPFYFFIYAYLFRQRSFKEGFIKSLPYFVLLAVFFLVRLKFASLKMNIFDKISLYDMNVFEYTASFTRIVSWYLLKLFRPFHIVIIWATPIIRNSLVFWNGLFSLCVLGLVFWARQKGRFPKITWAVFHLFIGFLPVTLACFFQPDIGLMIEPHWLLLPSIGFFVLLSLGITRLSRFVKKGYVSALAITLLIFYMAVARQMNDVWGNEKKYCEYWQQNTSSDLKSVTFYLANSYFKSHQDILAKKYFREALEGKFSDWQIYNNLGLIAEREGESDEAVRNYKKALAISPRLVATWNNLGVVYVKKGDVSSGESAFRQAIEKHRFYLEPRLNLAEIYIKKGDLDQAVTLYEDNLDIDPLDKNSLAGLTRVLLRKGKVTAAAERGRKLLKQSRDDNVLVEMGSRFARVQDIRLANEFYRKAGELNPGNKNVYLEWGKLLGNLGKFDEAVNLWQDGQKRFPQEKQFDVLIKQAQEIK